MWSKFDILEENDQIRQKAAVKSFTVLECHKDMLATLRIDKCMQCFEVIVEISSALSRNKPCTTNCDSETHISAISNM